MEVHINESHLLQKLKADDQNAFDQLFKQYYKYLVVIAYKYIKDDHLSKDLVQEVYMDLWKRRASIEIEQSLKYFLRRAVINRSLATIRKNSRITLDESAGLNESTRDNETEASFQMKELNEVLESAYGKLPPRCLEIFKLSRQEGLSHKEIAAKLDISTKTIENQMTKALKVIRATLKEYGAIGFFLLFNFFI